jgi:hypothetical protein
MYQLYPVDLLDQLGLVVPLDLLLHQYQRVPVDLEVL